MNQPKFINALIAFCFVVSLTVKAEPVSGFLPLTAPKLVQQAAQKVLITANMPILTRPISLTKIKMAMAKVCSGVSHLEDCWRLQAFLTGSTTAAPEPVFAVPHWVELSTQHWRAEANPFEQNQFGMASHSGPRVSIQSQNQINRNWTANIGFIAHSDQVVWQDAFVNYAPSWWQVSLGFQSNWWSPFRNSSLILSNNAATMPSMSFSSVTPISSWNFEFDVFIAKSTRSERINRAGQLSSGSPLINGFHFAIEPFPGVALGFNRVMQYGGVEAPNLMDIINGFFDPSSHDNSTQLDDGQQELGNQAGSFVVSYLFNANLLGAVSPINIYAEYGGEDASASTSFRLGNASLGFGIVVFNIFERLDFRFEHRTWQQGWYSHHIYQDGLTNDGTIIGDWQVYHTQHTGVRARGGFGSSLVVSSQVTPQLYLQSTLHVIDNEPIFGGDQLSRYQELAVESEYSYQSWVLSLSAVIGEDTTESRTDRVALSLARGF